MPTLRPTATVGRKTRVPPGWLHDAIIATHATCIAPGCTTAASLCDIDHHTPWHPINHRQPGGRTDLDNLAPLCRTDHGAKTRDGWTITPNPNGTRTWHHTRTNLTLTTHPNGTHRTRPHTGADPPDGH